MKQISLLKPESKSYGGTLLNTRKGRSHGRPLSTRHTMHLVLKSTKAVGAWSFKRSYNEKKIREVITKFAFKYGVRVISLANVGNHLHLHVKFSSRQTYKAFIRAITAAIAMAVTGASRWSLAKMREGARREGAGRWSQGRKGDTGKGNAHEGHGRAGAGDGNASENGGLKNRDSKNRDPKNQDRLKFWDYRPFTRVILGLRAKLHLADYVAVNQLEGEGVPRTAARLILDGRAQLRFLQIRERHSTA